MKDGMLTGMRPKNTKVKSCSDMPTGYSKYSKRYKEQEKHQDPFQLFEPLPEEKFEVIYMDPPWSYGTKMQYDHTAKSSVNTNYDKDIFISAAVFKYPTLSLDELKLLDVPSIAADNCILFMWVTNPHLAIGIDLAKFWGFEYRTVAFIWDKQQHNPGHYNLSFCEQVLLFKKGNIPTPRGTRNEKQLVSVKRKAHSEKPIEVFDAITRMFPEQKKIELFHRGAYHFYNKNPNWVTWGSESNIDGWAETYYKDKKLF